MKQLITNFLASSSLFLATSAQAQTTFSIGPRVGYSLSAASFNVSDYPDYFTTSGSYRSGFEAGVIAQVGFGNHFAVQPAVVYARKAPGFGTYSYYQPNNYSYKEEYALGLNYIMTPINLLYSQQPNGHGGQVFAGPYLGWLLGGTYRSTIGSAYSTSVSGGNTFTGTVKPGNTYATNYRDPSYALRKVDAGLQVGVGYGFDALQLQASFSLGLRNIGADYAPNAPHDYEAPVIRTRSFLLSAIYLFGLKS